MSGILERIEAKQDQILAMLTKTMSSETITPILSETITSLLPEVSTLKTDTGEIVFDDCGIPWDERIHSSNKKRTKDGKGSWSRRKNITDAEYTRVSAELREKYALTTGATQPHTKNGKPVKLPTQPVGAVTRNTDLSAGQSDVTQTTTVSDANTQPPPPQTESAPPPPTTPAATPPPPPADDTGAKKKRALNAINKLTNTYSVSYDAIVSYMMEEYSTPEFVNINPESYTGVAEDMDDWANRIDLINASIGEIKQIYAADVTKIEPYITKCFNQVEDAHGKPCENITTVTFNQLEIIDTSIDELLTQVKG